MEPNVVSGFVPSILLANLRTPLSKYVINLMKKNLSAWMVDDDTKEKITLDFVLSQSTILATELQILGCKPGRVVGILCENRLEYPIIVLSVLSTGAALCCFNPNYSREELEHTMKTVDPYVVFAEPYVIEKLKRIKCQNLKYIVNLEGPESGTGFTDLSYRELLKPRDANKLTFKEPKINCDDTALLLFSSGTTGLPKAVMLTNYSFVFLQEVVRLNPTPETPVALSVLPMFHISGMMTVLRFLTGMQNVVNTRRFNRDRFLSCIPEYKVTTLVLVPAIVVALVKDKRLLDFSSVKDAICGTAPLAPEMENKVISKFKLERINKVFGMTETTAAGSSSTLSDVYKSGSVGKLYPGMMAKVIDLQTGEALGPNKEGEICYKGVCLMKGYYNNEDATKEAIDEKGWYHSGDVGYYDEDEDFFVVDRIKDLIKYKGYQVPPVELELLLLQHEAIEDAAVVGIPDEEAGELPRAFVVKSKNITEREIIEYIAARVAPHMKLRGGVMFLSEIPRSPNGKTIRKALRSWRYWKL